jgi:hypothetical protein
VNPERFSQPPEAQISYQNGQSNHEYYRKNTKLSTVHSISFHSIQSTILYETCKNGKHHIKWSTFSVNLFELSALLLSHDSSSNCVIFCAVCGDFTWFAISLDSFCTYWVCQRI